MNQRNSFINKAWLPNLATTGALLAGFYSIVASINGNFTKASIAILVAIVLDGLDGRIARLTGTQSEFGAQYDSLSDLVNFGVAPAVLICQWVLFSTKIGWIVAFCYIAATAIRLARFNTNHATTSANYFQGLPSPCGAAIMSSFVWLGVEQGWSTATSITSVCIVVTLLCAMVMISNFRYFSGKESKFDKRKLFAAAAVLVGLLFIIDLPLLIFSLCVIYMFSGMLHLVPEMEEDHDKELPAG